MFAIHGFCTVAVSSTEFQILLLKYYNNFFFNIVLDIEKNRPLR